MAEFKLPVSFNGVDAMKNALIALRKQMENEDYWEDDTTEDFKAGVMFGVDAVLHVLKMLGKKKKAGRGLSRDNNSVSAGFEEEE